MPLWLEPLIGLAAACLISVGVDWHLFGRAKKDSYL